MSNLYLGQIEHVELIGFGTEYNKVFIDISVEDYDRDSSVIRSDHISLVFDLPENIEYMSQFEIISELSDMIIKCAKLTLDK